MYKYYTLKDGFNLSLFEFSKKTSNDDFNLFKNDFDKLLKKKDVFVAVFNLLNIESFNINFFYQKMNYIYSNKEEVKKYLKASSIIISKNYIKLIELGFVFKKPITPNYLTSNLESGIQYLLEINKKN